MTACPRCTAPVAEGARFCSSCGFALDAAPREERRVVTILFADLVEFTAMSETRDPEVVKRIIDRAFEGLAEIVTVYGGTVDKILGDEIMAVFGAPQAHEDDPERAVRCALEMQRSLATYSMQLRDERGLELKMRVGVNTGEVVAGAIGGGDAYTVVGDAVNVASRLVKAADPGRVLVGPATRSASTAAIEYRDLPPLTVKGKTEAIAAAEAVAERSTPAGHEGRAAPIVGRDSELTLLRSIAEIVERDRRPAAVTVIGDAGMGKSRLVAEFTRRLHDARVLWGRSLPYGSASPSHAVEEMVRAALDVTGAEDAAAARKRIADRLAPLGLGQDVERVAQLAGVREQPQAVAAAHARRQSAPGPAAGSAARGGEMSTAIALFEALARRETLLVLVFQELHWAEPAVAATIGELLERGAGVPLLVLALGRVELAERAAQWPARPGSTLLHLAPLSRAAAAELLDALAGDHGLHPSVRENVLDRAGGNPFFIEEFVRLSVDRGEPGPMSVPVSVQSLVAARLDTLEPAVKAVAQDAAVVGEEFWAGALEAVEPRHEEALRAALDALVAREMIEPVPVPRFPDRSEYRFRQTIVREVAYAALPKQARAVKHAAVAGWLEQTSAECGLESDFLDLIAHHYERAAESARDVGLDGAAYGAKAREYLERAGDEAMGKDAATTAAGFYERALPFAKNDEDALHLRVHLGEAFVGSWNPVPADAHLQRALADARRLGDRRMEGKSLRLLGDLARIRGDHDASRAYLEPALALARETGDALEEAEGLRSHGLLDMFNGRVPAAPLWFRQALARSRDLGDTRGEGWSLQNLGWANLLLGRIDEALAALEEGAMVFGGMGDIEGVGWCLGLQSWALLFQGHIDEADTLAAQLMEMAATGVDDNPGGMGGMGIEVERVLRAIVAMHRMKLTDAIAIAVSTFPRFSDVESNWGQAMARYPIAVAHLMRHELAEARAVLDEGARHAEAAGDPLVQGLIGMVSALVEIEAGNLDVAERDANAAATVTEAAGVGWHSRVPAMWIRGEIARRRGMLRDALAAVRDDSGEPETGGLFPAGRLQRVHAEILCDGGDPARAVEHARSALIAAGPALADALASRRVLARALLESGSPRDALAEVDAALAGLEAGEWDAERVRALVLRSRILDDLGRHDEASESFDAAKGLLGSFPLEADVRCLRESLGL